MAKKKSKVATIPEAPKLPKVDLSKYDNYQEYLEYNTCQFLNPHTGREIVVPIGTATCPKTGKPF